MSETTYISFCESNPEKCDKIRKRIGTDLHELVKDDWRRPIVDGILWSVFAYRDEERERQLRILEDIGYPNLAKVVREVLDERGEREREVRVLVELVLKLDEDGNVVDVEAHPIE